VKLLLFSDLHVDLAAAKRIVENARHVDVVIGAGDFGNVRRDLQRCIDALKVIELPTVLVAGNNESADELIAACRNWPSAHVLHGSSVTIANVTFFGIGGGIPVTPFGSWSFDFTEDEASDLLANCPPRCVLVSHSPPHGAVDLSSRGQHLGSIAVREAVERLSPLLVVCGHIHGSAGQVSQVGDTPVVNAGPESMSWQLKLGDRA
jgi:Icc-related predicted phosphoesterase